MTNSIPESMRTYGQRLGARNRDGFANWSEEVISSPVSGMINTVPQSLHPHDGRRRLMPIIMRMQSGHWVEVAHAVFDGQCRLERYDLLPVIATEDKEIIAFVKRYADKIPTLDCMSTQREYPLQSSKYPWLILRLGEISVI